MTAVSKTVKLSRRGEFTHDNEIQVDDDLLAIESSDRAITYKLNISRSSFIDPLELSPYKVMNLTGRYGEMVAAPFYSR